MYQIKEVGCSYGRKKMRERHGWMDKQKWYTHGLLLLNQRTFLNPPSLRGPDFQGWGRVLFSSNQIKPRMQEHGWEHGKGAGKSRPSLRGAASSNAQLAQPTSAARKVSMCVTLLNGQV